MTIDFKTARVNSDIVDDLCRILKRPQDQLLNAIVELKRELDELREEIRVLRGGNGVRLCPTDDNKKICNCSSEAIGGICCACGVKVDPEYGQRRSFPG